jgi:hypothetical protein
LKGIEDGVATNRVDKLFCGANLIVPAACVTGMGDVTGRITIDAVGNLVGSKLPCNVFDPVWLLKPFDDA